MSDIAGPSVAIIGAGAIGSAIAGALTQARSCRLAICVRRVVEWPARVMLPRAPAINLEGRIIRHPGEFAEAPGLVFLCVKSMQIPACAAWLQSLPSPTPVVAVQNGVDQESRVRAVSPDRRVIPAIVDGACRRRDARTVSIPDEFRVHLPVGVESETFAALFRGSFARVGCVRDFKTAQWRKMCVIAPTGLMAAHRETARIFRDASIFAAAARLVEECAAVARAEGASIGTGDIRAVVDGLRSLPDDAGSSILSDALAGTALEWDARHGVVLRRGMHHQVPTPETERLIARLR